VPIYSLSQKYSLEDWCANCLELEAHKYDGGGQIDQSVEEGNEVEDLQQGRDHQIGFGELEGPSSFQCFVLVLPKVLQKAGVGGQEATHEKNEACVLSKEDEEELDGNGVGGKVEVRGLELEDQDQSAAQNHPDRGPNTIFEGSPSL
jgi:hypothetical protein